MKHRLLYPANFAALGVVALAILATIALAHGKPAAAPAARKTQATQTAAAKTEPPAAGSSSSTKTDASSKPAGGTKAPDSPACKAFALAAAQQVLGAHAKTAGTSATGDLQTNSTTVSACAYASSSGSLQLTLRTPKNALGVSENATVFGSERLAGAVTVTGYGQSAYWDPGKHQLNVLGHNNWYIIARTTAGQSDSMDGTKAIADKLVAEF